MQYLLNNNFNYLENPQKVIGYDNGQVFTNNAPYIIYTDSIKRTSIGYVDSITMKTDIFSNPKFTIASPSVNSVANNIIVILNMPFVCSNIIEITNSDVLTVEVEVGNSTRTYTKSLLPQYMNSIHIFESIPTNTTETISNVNINVTSTKELRYNNVKNNMQQLLIM